MNKSTGKLEKSCHCAESDLIFDRTESRWAEDGIPIPGLPESNRFPFEDPANAEMAQNVHDAYGQFFRTGTFPENTLLSYAELPDNTFNIIGATEFRYEQISKNECDALDKADNYLWDKWNAPFECSGDECTITLNDGTKFLGKDRDGVVEFRSVPYAQAPTGPLRWRAPILIDDYHGAEIDAREYASACASILWDGSYPSESEDCLYLNINVKRSVLDNKETTPVIYYIHGGGYNYGSNKEQYTKMVLEQDVAVISIAYRLGVYGFLVTEEAGNEYNANWGIQDQITAFKWIQKFGESFGVNIREASLAGCSAGAESTLFHMSNPKTWNYFNKAVTFSVGPNSAYDLDLGKKLASTFADLAGCSDMDCLRALPGGSVGQAALGTVRTVTHPIKPTLEAGWGAVIDGHLLRDQLKNLFESGDIRPNTPLSWNYNGNESWGLHTSFFPYSSKIPSLLAKIPQIQTIMKDTGFAIPSDYSDEYLKAVYRADVLDGVLDQFGCPSENGETVDCSEPFANFLTTSTWSCPLRRTLNVMSEVCRIFNLICTIVYTTPL